MMTARGKEIIMTKAIFSLAASLFAAVLFCTSPLHAADRTITLEASVGQSLPVPGRASTVFVANPEIADVQASADGASLFLFGKAPGITSVVALSAGNQPLVTYQVTVTPPISGLRQRLSSELPDHRVSVESTPKALILSGEVASPGQAQRAVEIAKTYLGKDQTVVNRMSIAVGTQVNLRVRVAEVSRSVTKELGFNWESLFNIGAFTLGIATGRDAITAAGTILRGENGSATLPFGYRSSNADINVVIDALATDGLISVLAEPNLVALSGEMASFLAGGEFPIPVAQHDDELSIEFKKFGVSLDFVPTVLSGNRINMRVRPEVSELTDQGAIEINGLRIPALSVRRAETTVELGSGQSFAIAGLLQNTSRTNVDKVPGLGDIPVLGTLFRSSRFQRNETELVIVITPYIVRPVSQATAIAVPNDAVQPASDLERIFLGRINTPNTAIPPIGPGAARLKGDVGFMLE
jgi:pilus assembly protein CpaC